MLSFPQTDVSRHASATAAHESVEPYAREDARIRARRAAAEALSVPADALLDSPALADVLKGARRLASMAGSPVLLQGERGTGLLELARYIHEEDLSSRRAQFRMVAGRFIGDARTGKVKSGTLYIEDVEDLTPMGQDWLMTLLTEGTAANRHIRVIAGSRYSVGELLGQRRLSSELFLTLDVGRLVLPPLRERPGDILELAHRFLRLCGAAQGRPRLRFSLEAESVLRAHSYPGNTRELRSVVERAVALETTDQVRRQAIVFHDDLHAQVQSRAAAESAARRIAAADTHRRCALPSLSEMEREYMLMLIRELRGKRTEMSRVMGVSYPTVLKKLASHGLDVRAILADENAVAARG